MIRQVLNVWPGWRWRPRTIRRDLRSALVYLKRWYLTRMPTMPDGSFPYDTVGRPKPEIINDDASYSTFLHQFGQDDEDDPHNHPWTWGLSFIFKGGYIEERYDPRTGKSVYYPRPAPCISFIKHGEFHRVTLVNGEPTWSIFFTGRKVSSWGFIDRRTRKFLYWQEYFAKGKNGALTKNGISKDADWHLEPDEDKF